MFLAVRAAVPRWGYFFRGQVLMPSSVYAGQNLNSPVARGMTPSQPHHPTVPVAARAMSTRPATIRNTRSMVPT